MTLNEFFTLFPVSRKGIAQMLGMPEKHIYNLLQRRSYISDEELGDINYALSELSHQLSKVFIHNVLRYNTTCLRCKKKFTAIDEDERAIIYANHGLVCDECIQKLGLNNNLE